MSKAKQSLREDSGVQATNAEAEADGIPAAAPIDADDVADAALEAERARWLPTSELSDAEREAYLACEVEGLAPSELAALPDVDVSPSTVRTQLSRARRKVEEASR